ncbi:UNVERIFIED_CONTAM: hypothetical protein Sradi_4440800 [Sesamum radiatum]|uniref:Uncharacterized protein n=1 Tax=Sesamum radiatum TaxID=300843 RepID=A0AAW2NQH1_SESRA
MALRPRYAAEHSRPTLLHIQQKLHGQGIDRVLIELKCRFLGYIASKATNDATGSFSVAAPGDLSAKLDTPSIV